MSFSPVHLFNLTTFGENVFGAQPSKESGMIECLKIFQGLLIQMIVMVMAD